MRQHLSIKIFILLIFLFVFSGVSWVFYTYYKHSSTTITELFTANFQKNALNLQHLIDNNEDRSYSQIKAQLDSRVSLSKSIKDIHIFNNKHQLLYATSRANILYDRERCIPVTKLNTQNILTTECYSLKSVTYDGLKTLYDDVHIHMSQEYLDSLLVNQKRAMLNIFFLIITIVALLVWYFIQKYLSNPLETLRQFAYYHNKIPDEMFIEEFESIRYSLDITFNRLEKEQKELYELSTRDPLSGLYNRISLVEKIEWLIANHKRTKTEFALLFFDLDNFKDINDIMGHNIGDGALQYLSKILVASIRETDFASRVGGDEFVIVIPDLDAQTKAIEVIRRIQKRLNTPFMTQELKHYLTASVGISIFPKDAQDVHTLLKNADIAMYKAKELGKNNFRFFTEELNKQIHEKVMMQNLLVEAFEKGYFELYYQPKTDVQSGKIIACEALIRLVHPLKGVIPPNEFISVAEENNFIITLGEWVIEEAVKQVQAWEGTPYEDIVISINISAKQFLDTNFVQKLAKQTQNIDKTKLDIELTESVFVNHFDEQNILLQKIKELGFTLSLDDFGTGYSSLSYLKEISFDTLKIDKAFIDDLEKENGAQFVQIIVEIAHMFHFHVVAEGVETEEQRAYLESIACDFYQGYLCSKPLPIKQFEELIKSQYNF